jgi:hypothetical protein
VIVQAAAVVALVAVIGLSLGTRSTLGLAVVHERNPIAVTLSDGRVRNAYEVRVTNTGPVAVSYDLRVAAAAPVSVAAAGAPGGDGDRLLIEVPADETRRLRITLSGRDDAEGPVTFTLVDPAGETATAADFFRLP